MVLLLKIIRTFKKLAFNHQKDKEKVLFCGRSDYRLLTIVENKKQHTRTMYTGNRLFVAGINTKTGFPLNSPYFIADIFVPNPKTLLLLGGGANAVATYAWNNYQPKRIDVVERDPLTTILSKKYFNLPHDNKFIIHHEDAKIFLKRNNKKCDIIYFNLGLTRKRGLNKRDLYDLCSFEGIKTIRKHLQKRGVLIYVIIARLEGEDLQFIKKLMVSFNKLFPSNYILLDNEERSKKIQSVVIISTFNKTKLKNLYQKAISSSTLKHEQVVYETILKKIQKTPWKLSR